MGNCTVCHNVRPRYKIYVRGVFENKIDDLCTFAKSYPNQLPRIARYLFKQLNLRVQQHRSHYHHQQQQQKQLLISEIHFAMRAWNDLIFTCNAEIKQFEGFILQSIILVFAADFSSKVHQMAMKTLRKYLPYSHKVSEDDFNCFVEHCTLLAESDTVQVRIDALKTLSVMFAYVQQHSLSQFCPDLYLQYDQIVRAIVINLDANSHTQQPPQLQPLQKAHSLSIELDSRVECDVYAEHTYEQFCALLSINTLNVMLRALIAMLTEHCNWTPIRFAVKLLDILYESNASIKPMSIVQEMLYILSRMHYEHEHVQTQTQLPAVAATAVSALDDDTFIGFMERLTTMDAMVCTLQQFASRVIPPSGTCNRNPIVSKLCALFHVIGDGSTRSDSMELSTHKLMRFADDVLDCVQCYVVGISYVDAQSVLLRMLKQLALSKSLVHSQLQLSAILRCVAHRTGKVQCVGHTQHGIVQCAARVHLELQFDEHHDVVIEMLHLALVNLFIVASSAGGGETQHCIGFDQTQWAVERIETFLESHIRCTSLSSSSSSSSSSAHSAVHATATHQSPMHMSRRSQSSWSSPTSSMSSSPTTSGTTATASAQAHGNELMICALSPQQRQWLFAVFYAYLENAKNLSPVTIQRVTQTVIVVALSQATKRFTRVRKIDSEIIDFELLLSWLMAVQKLALKYEESETSESQSQSRTTSMLCHSMVLAVLLYIRSFLYAAFAKASNYQMLFAEFSTLVDDVYQQRKTNNEIWSAFRVHSNGLITCESAADAELRTVTNHVPFEDIIDSLQAYFEVVNGSRTSVSAYDVHLDGGSTYKQRLQKSFAVDAIIDEICRNSDEDMELSMTSHNSHSFQPLQPHMRGSLDFDEPDRDSMLKQLHSIDNTRPLEECGDFHEIVYAYLDHVDTVQQVQLSVIAQQDSPVLPSSESLYGAHSHSQQAHLQSSAHSSSQQKTFTFSSSDIEAHVLSFNKLGVKHSDGLYDAHGLNLAQFVIRNQCAHNPSVLLYDALCVRLDLFDVQCDALQDHNSCANVEHELMDLDHEHFLALSHGHQPISVLALPSSAHAQFELTQSPMRQLKERGISAVNHIRSRMQQMNVRHNMNFANFKNTQNAITQKTKQGFNVTKRKFQTVKTKVLEQTRTKTNKKKEKQRKKVWNVNVNKFRRSLDIQQQQRGVGIPMTVTNLQMKTPIDVYQDEHDSFSDSSVEISLSSASTSQGSVATV